jgi:HEAT repeat protein
MDQPVNRRLREIKSAYLRPAVAVTLTALTLAGVFLSRPQTPQDDRKQPAQATESKVSASVGHGRLDALSPEEIWRLQDLAVPVLIPGALPSGQTGKNLQLLAAELLDESRPLKVRRQAAWNLAKLRSPEAFAILRQSLATAPIQLKATIAEVLGNFDGAEPKALLRLLLNSDNEVVVRGAMRGWAALGDSEAEQLLSKILSDQEKGDDLRTEAALNLGKINSPRAYQVLIDGLNKIPDSELATTILTGLGQRSFIETESFFRSYLGRTDVPTGLRVAALESLGQADGNPVPLLLQHLESNDSRVRAASAWALSMVENPPDVAPQLFKQLEGEGSAEVRTRIYQAMENQSNVSSEALLSAVLNDQALSSRISGLKLLAGQVSRQNSPMLATEFDSVAVPQLEKIAINGAELQHRLVSVMALKQARTPSALQALNKIAAQSAEPRIIAAAKVK